MTKPTPMTITINQVGSGNNQPWHLTNNGKECGPGQYPSVDVHINAGADLTIQIVKTTGVTFSQDPIWVSDTASKPTASGLGQYITVTGGQGTATLVIHDTNVNPGTLNYVLNFNGASSLDPIIKNTGGGPPATHPEYLIAGAVVLALLVAFILRKVFAAKRVDDTNDVP